MFVFLLEKCATPVPLCAETSLPGRRNAKTAFHFLKKVLDIYIRLCYTIITKRKGDLKMKKYIITYRSFKVHWDKEVYTEAEKEIAEWRFDALKNCVNADNVKMEIKED